MSKTSTGASSPGKTITGSAETFFFPGPQGNTYPWGDEFDCTRGNFDDETEVTRYVVSGGEGCDGYARTAPVGSFEEGNGLEPSIRPAEFGYIGRGQGREKERVGGGEWMGEGRNNVRYNVLLHTIRVYTFQRL
jgi:hypothetical protein